MTQTYIHGVGAVSPAGWGVAAMRPFVQKKTAAPMKDLARPGWDQPLRVRRVPAPAAKPLFMSHARLRRSSPITQYAVAAALEALGGDIAMVAARSLRLGIVFCAMSGCVNYSRRFYDETLKDPASASPLVFPETVFNAPSSHLAALLGTTAINYTLVGDPGTFLQGIALAADWLASEPIDGCLVVGAEELDWLTADAFRLFSRDVVLSEGAGALYLRRSLASRRTVELKAITDAHLFTSRAERMNAAASMRASLPEGSEKDLLCDGLQNVPRLDKAEVAAWTEWPGERLSLKPLFGEGLMAAAAWQCVTAVDALQRGVCASTLVSVVGSNQQAIGAHFG